MILSIDTSTNVCSVALHHELQLIASAELHLDKSHSGYLIVLIREILAKSNIEAHELSAIAISEGPGSYTGLRIGTATAKGLCYAHDLPLIAVNTLEAMAKEVAAFFPQTSTLLCPMIDARRMEVYFAGFDGHMNPIEKTRPLIIDQNSFQNQLKQFEQLILFGNGADKCKEIMSQYENTKFIDEIYPSAKYVGLLAFEKWKSNQFENLAYFEPFYLKEFQVTKSKKLLL